MGERVSPSPARRSESAGTQALPMWKPSRHDAVMPAMLFMNAQTQKMREVGKTGTPEGQPPAIGCQLSTGRPDSRTAGQKKAVPSSKSGRERGTTNFLLQTASQPKGWNAPWRDRYKAGPRNAASFYRIPLRITRSSSISYGNLYSYIFCSESRSFSTSPLRSRNLINLPWSK